jgi:hypothetical protein
MNKVIKWFKFFWEELNKPQPIHNFQSEIFAYFTPRAREVVDLARAEAGRLSHSFIGTEHLLLGLIRLNQGCAANVLRKLGIDSQKVISEVEQQIGKGDSAPPSANIPFTPRVKKIFILARKEAKGLHHTYIGTEHILLGILREGDGTAARVLQALNVNLEQTRALVLQELDPKYVPPVLEAITPEPPAQKRASVDPAKRYDLYCREGDVEVIHRNVLLIGDSRLLEKDADVELLEIEQADGKRLFIARYSLFRLCEHVPPPS